MASAEVKKRAESGSKGTVRDRVLMRRPLFATDTPEDLGQRWGSPALPVSPGCKPQAFVAFFLRFCGVSLKASYVYRWPVMAKMAKG